MFAEWQFSISLFPSTFINLLNYLYISVSLFYPMGKKINTIIIDFVAQMVLALVIRNSFRFDLVFLQHGLIFFLKHFFKKCFLALDVRPHTIFSLGPGIKHL